MLSSKISNVLYLLKNKTVPGSMPVNFLTTSSTRLNFMNNQSKEDKEKKEKKLKEWRTPLIINPRAEKNQKIRDPDKGFFGIFRVNIPLTPWGMKEYVKIRNLGAEREAQKFDKFRNQILGSDLSAAHFLIFRGGKVKFKGQNDWLSMKTDKIQEILPQSFDINYILEEIDASDVVFFYEGLENFENVTRIKRAIFKNSPFLDDWCIDKISTIFPLLEHLDVTNCLKVSERGLEGLYKASNLKELIITNNRKSAAFELTCMMLEDCLPNLKIKILDPPNKQSVVNKS